ncbi:MAG: hypothetical protein ABSG55_07745 [Dehalococcoidia bacterium]
MPLSVLLTPVHLDCAYQHMSVASLIKVENYMRGALPHTGDCVFAAAHGSEEGGDKRHRRGPESAADEARLEEEVSAYAKEPARLDV